MANDFKSLIRSFLDYNDGGKFFRHSFRIIYIAIAVLTILSPFIVLWAIANSDLLEYFDGRGVVGLTLMWIILLAGAIGMAFLWWIRAGELKHLGYRWTRADEPKGSKYRNDEYPVTPVVAHFLRTAGEAGGLYIGVVMFLVNIMALIFIRLDFLVSIPHPYCWGWIGTLLLPLAGFLHIVFWRWLSEMIRVLVNIAQTNKSIEYNTEK